MTDVAIGELPGASLRLRRAEARDGSAILRWVCDEARRRGCVVAQLTSDKRRVDAIRFPEAFGIHATHEGRKLILD